LDVNNLRFGADSVLNNFFGFIVLVAGTNFNKDIDLLLDIVDVEVKKYLFFCLKFEHIVASLFYRKGLVVSQSRL
jgi:hypothetical protein